jgi:hypothetical protein
MAHYAFLDKDNIVTEVIAGVEETELIEGLTPENWYSIHRGTPCKRTSYNGNIRNRFAGIGFQYLPEFDVFVTPRPYPSWKLNYTTFNWSAPVAKPNNIEGYVWRWSEINKEWIQAALPTEN